ncbi:uncharacterized protein LOC126664278 [Mercurialis annua]|uniref:uncharacterized protein LOC126664278 n=1 Tax=Mercurialis annua TaxID=3986 RepID=UPI00216073CE|nr:uncharacterized protein LOC126664278 [Mercurialis annua]XP_050212544.1 uncharacterized protein LOC126664278 [Mercurialis annua]
MAMEKISRKDKRKEGRKSNKQQKHQSWLQHQQSQKTRKAQLASTTNKKSKPKSINKSRNSSPLVQTSEKKNKNVVVRPEVKSKMVKERKGVKRARAKTKFEEFLEMDMKNSDPYAEEDLEMERRLAKKLKGKDGKLEGMDEDMNSLLDGIFSMHNSSENVQASPESRKHKKLKASDEFSGDEMDSDLMDGLSELEDTSDTDIEQEEYADGMSSHKKSKKHKSKQKQEGDVAGDTTDNDIVGEDFDVEGTNVALSEEEEEEEEGATKTASWKRRQRRKKSKLRQEGDIVGETNVYASKPAKVHKAEGALQKTPTDVPAIASSLKYVPPGLRSLAGKESEEQSQIRRRVRGLLNRLSETNVEAVTAEMATVFCSASRSVSSQIITDEVLAACSRGPRGNEQYAAVFAAFVAGMACSVGIDFSAKLLASLAKSFEDEYHKEDNMSLRNLTLLLSFLCTFGVCYSDLIYDFLDMLSKRLEEIDVSTILTVLQCCGMKIRSDDPTAMKNFIQCVQSRVNELKASSEEDHEKLIGKRMEFMLETICDIKNNKKRHKEDVAQHTRIKKWLQKLNVEEILIKGLKWSKLVDPGKKGQWWLSGNTAAKTDDIDEVANTIDKEVLEAQKMLQLAASQRMNTDARKAIFCIVMSGEDYIDAFEKLLRLDLPGKQDREIMRVVVECCLQEKVFNKYYTALASKLCEHDKNHKYTLQYCLWDHFKELESTQLLRSMHLAKFVAEMVTSFSLSLSALKSAELGDAAQLTPKRIMHFRMIFESLFEYPDKLVWNAFTRVAINPELESLRDDIEFFIREYVVKTNKALANKLKLAKKALNNTEGVLM